MIYDNKAVLIDFVTADLLNIEQNFYIKQGLGSICWSKGLIDAVKNQKGFFYQPRWDYESLAFSIFLSAISESEIEQNFKN